jgi:hypothetical protein
MNEIVQAPVQFGEGQRLLGMVTQSGDKPAVGVACLMLNMGANHRVGPHRVNVKLAHALARVGMVSMRFDLGGVGDSLPGGKGLDLRQRAVDEIRAAMDLLQANLNIRKFVIVGMCSGAEHAIAAALEDPRVVGISTFDAFNFPDGRSRWRRFLHRAWAAPRHPAFAAKALRWFGKSLAGRGNEKPMPGFFTENRSPKVIAQWFSDAMDCLTEWNVSVHMLFSGSLNVSDHDKDQLGAFRQKPFVRKVHYEFCRELDHTACTLKGQQILVRAVGRWAMTVAQQADAGQVSRQPVDVFREKPKPAYTARHATPKPIH